MEPAKDDAQDRLLGVREVCAILSLSEASVRKLTREGRLPSLHPLGMKAVRYRERDIRQIARTGVPKAPAAGAPTKTATEVLE